MELESIIAAKMEVGYTVYDGTRMPAAMLLTNKICEDKAGIDTFILNDS